MLQKESAKWFGKLATTNTLEGFNATEVPDDDEKVPDDEENGFTAASLSGMVLFLLLNL